MADPHLAGQIEQAVPSEELVGLLEGEGLSPRLRNSTHYSGGAYVRVDLGSVTATLETTSTDVLVRADAETLQDLSFFARLLSSRLTTAGQRHRLELYERDHLVEYLHFGWPAPSELASPG